MKRIFKKNQVIITTLAIMIAIAGYLNFSGDKWTLGVDELAKEVSKDAEDTALLEISDEDLYAAGEIFTDEFDEDTPVSSDNIPESTPGEAVLTSAEGKTALTAQAKISREQMRSKNKDVLMEVINNVNVADAQKQAAIDAMIALTDIAERESEAEMLLQAKGFSDVIVNIVDDTADVVVNMPQIDDAQRAQIEDIMKRKTGVAAENIVITPME